MHRHVGIYSGTFDPVHQGHVAFAEAAVAEARLDQLFFLPEPQPRGKQPVLSVAARIELITQATATMPQLRPLALPFEQYTVQHTLPYLQQHLPDARLSLLVGSDTLQTMRHWDDIAGLLNRMQLIIGVRAQDTEATILAAIRQLEDSTQAVVRYLVVRTHPDAAAAASSPIRAGKATSGIPAVDAALAQRQSYR